MLLSFKYRGFFFKINQKVKNNEIILNFNVQFKIANKNT